MSFSKNEENLTLNGKSEVSKKKVGKQSGF